MTEHQMQMAIFQWAKYQEMHHPELRFMFAIPNGSKRNLLTAINLKREGVKAGVPDIFLPVARHGYHGMFVEMKKDKKARLSEFQNEYIVFLKAQGYMTYIGRGIEETIREIEKYLG